MTELAEKLAREVHDEQQRRSHDHMRRPWATLHPSDKGRRVDAMAALLARGVLAEGVPDSGEGFERELFATESDLPARFYAEGMVWLANRVLHPFGWAIGIMADGPPQAGEQRPEKVIGLVLQRTADTDGIVISVVDEVRARRNFFAAIERGATVVKTAEPSPDVILVPTVCGECGFDLWIKDDGRTGCGNPRCELYKPFPREA